MGVRRPMLTDEQWEKIRPLIPAWSPRPKGGRPSGDHRACKEGIPRVLKTGARWRDLPVEFPDGSTCWRRLMDRLEAGVSPNMWRAFLAEWDANHILDWKEAFVDATFVPAKKGERRSEKPKGARERSTLCKSMARVFLREASPTLHRPPSSRLSKMSWQTSGSPKKDQADPKPDPSE